MASFGYLMLLIVHSPARPSARLFVDPSVRPPARYSFRPPARPSPCRLKSYNGSFDVTCNGHARTMHRSFFMILFECQIQCRFGRKCKGWCVSGRLRTPQSPRPLFYCLCSRFLGWLFWKQSCREVAFAIRRYCVYISYIYISCRLVVSLLIGDTSFVWKH